MKSTLIQIAPNARLDTVSQELIFQKDGNLEHVHIEPLTTRLLAYLSSNGNELATRDQLVAALWEGNEGVGNKALTRNIYKIRKTFEAHGLADPIETIPKKGYRLKRKGMVQLPRQKKKKRGWLIAAGVIIGFIALKLLMPGMFHMVKHGMMH